MAGSVVVNQVPYDFYSVEFELAIAGGQSLGIVQGIEEIEYNCTINREPMYGRSRTPVKETDGDAEFDASMSIHRDHWHAIRKMAQEAGIPLAKLELICSVTYTAEDEELVTDTLIGVKLSEIGNSHSRGPEGLVVALSMYIRNVFYSGEDVFGQKLAA